MNALIRVAALSAVCACAAGCATPGASTGMTATSRLSGTRTATADHINAIVVGKSAKAEVIAALGKTTVISFDSGFEVWVYQYAGGTGATAAGSGVLERIARGMPPTETPGNAEFVVLFAPSGIVTKTRVRPAPLPGGAAGS